MDHEAKKFQDVFKTLNLDKRNKELFENVIVTGVSATKSRDFIRVLIVSDHIIPKASIYRVEKQLKKTLFEKHQGTVKILESFNLSDYYTPQILFEEYGDSISLELSKYGVAEKTLYDNAEVTFPEEGVMLLTVEDEGFLKGKQNDLKRIIEKVFTERCGVSVNVVFEFTKPQVKTYENGGYEFVKVDAPLSVKRDEPQDESEENAPVESKTKEQPREKQPQKDNASKERTLKGGLGLEGRYKDKKAPVKREFKSDNPDVLFGRDFEETDPTPIERILSETAEDIEIDGQIIAMQDPRPLRDGLRTMLIYDMTDFTDSIRFKIFVPNDDLNEIMEKLPVFSFIKIKGPITFDKYDDELSIGRVLGIKKGVDTRVTRKDTAPLKRVELHCHTKMSDMDGISETKDIVKTAFKWGHPAIAITDHGVVHAFPDANHTWESFWEDKVKAIKASNEAKKAAAEEEGRELDPSELEVADKQDFFKIIYGCEGYLVDDLMQTVINDRGQGLDVPFVVFDLETTGLSSSKNRIIEIGAVKVENGEIIDRFSSFVNPEVPIPFRIIKLTSITDDMVKSAPKIEEILPSFVEFCKGCVLVAHNAAFDTGFINENCHRLGIDFEYTSVDTMGVSRMLFPDSKKHTLDVLCKRMGVVLDNHHRAVDDAEATANIFLKMIKRMSEQGIETLTQINEACDTNPDIIKHQPAYHVIILAKNNTGRENLYRLVSTSFIDYFSGKPRIPKSVLQKNREGLIVGSACEQGELFQALLWEASSARVSEIVDFYDYLEIQPLGNNKFMIADESIENVNNMDDLIELNKEIVKLGEEANKPVVATCDVHFLNPEDEIYRRIIMAGKGFKDADDQAPLYLRTTDEMLEEFKYLGPKKAEEVVITNTVKIANQIDVMSPVRPDKCPPVIPNSDETLRKICYDKAHELYGEELPSIVEERLEKELASIIGNGYAVMYIIAQKLVWKSVEDGYLVGSRGSVGSSLVAFMAGITEVNSLAAHYRCPKCRYVDFDSEIIKQYVGNAGCDLPDAVCPVCGEPLVKDGFDIPFETFLGFKGDKEPDIDLNFSSEYQSKAHKYTEVIFGAGQTYRAGTVTGLADKTAFGYVKNYFKDHETVKREAEINRISLGCIGVRRGTGQHPGGIIVLPNGEDINSFTPIQHPPKDDSIITTHFDYHSIDHNLLKLDILGHDDPTMIRMLQDLTGLDPTQIPLDDKQVMTLFQNTSALGIRPEDIDGVKTGSLGIPEFGTPFVIEMLMTTKPQTLSDLIRISGLGHGTDVWLGNAETIIKEGKADLAHCICCRDDIMIYLIAKGLDPAESFSIMENVRKGKVAGGKCKDWGHWKQDMIDHDVPEWYIWSCEKIKYMFPKAHAAAYVMMAWRVGYYKINYPLEYYASFFSIRAKAFDYEKMCFGQGVVLMNINALKDKEDGTKTDDDTLKDLHLVLEMYARGYEFMPIDIYRVHSRLFQVIDGKIMPSLTAIAGVAEMAADSIVEAAKMGEFTSRDDFRERCKVSKTIVDTMARLGILSDIPESNQISLFDFMN